MKKLSLVFLAAASLFLSFSCSKDGETTPPKTYLDYVIKDYQALVAEYPDAKDRFVEARFVLDNYISEVPAADIKVKTLSTICYVWLEGHSEIFVCERDFTTGKTELINYESDSPWLGDMQISEDVLKSYKFSLEDAIAAAKKEAGSGDGLNTANVTLRKPIYPFWENAQYVFGGSAGRHDHVFVDAKTGKVSIEEMPVPEGSAQAFLIDDYNKILDVYKNYGQFEYSIELQGKMVQIRYELNEAVNAAKADDLAPVKATYVFYYPQTDEVPAYLISVSRTSFKLDAELSEYKEEKLSSPWTGGNFISADYIDGMVSLDDAVNAVKFGNVTDTDTNIVTLCALDGFENPVYEFKGEKTATVYVDCISADLVEKK